MEVRKITGFMLSSVEVADDYPGLGDHVRGVLDGSIIVPPPLPDPGPNPHWEALLAAAADSPVLVELLQLHKPHAACYPATIRWLCHGEEPNGYDAEWPDWPCETTAIIAHHFGVDIADDPDHH